MQVVIFQHSALDPSPTLQQYYRFEEFHCLYLSLITLHAPETDHPEIVVLCFDPRSDIPTAPALPASATLRCSTLLLTTVHQTLGRSPTKAGCERTKVDWHSH